MIIIAILSGKATHRCFRSLLLYYTYTVFFSFFLVKCVHFYIAVFPCMQNRAILAPQEGHGYKLTRISLGSFPFNFLKHIAPTPLSPAIVSVSLFCFIIILVVYIHVRILYSRYYNIRPDDLFLHDILTRYPEKLDNSKSIDICTFIDFHCHYSSRTRGIHCARIRAHVYYIIIII